MSDEVMDVLYVQLHCVAVGHDWDSGRTLGFNKRCLRCGHAMKFLERGESSRWKWRHWQWWLPRAERQVYLDGVRGGFWGSWGPFRLTLRLVRTEDDRRYWMIDAGWR